MHPYSNRRAIKKLTVDSIQSWKYGHKNFQNKSGHVKQKE